MDAQRPLSYADCPLSSRYLAEAPADVQPTPALYPVESFWSWRQHQVHLDRTAPKGPSRGTVILVHGGGGNGRLLAPFAVALARAGYTAVAPDLPPYGLTRTDAAVTPTLDAWVELVFDLAAHEAAAGGPVTLFGLSMGGMTALSAAARAQRADRRDLIRAVVVTTLLDMRDPSTLDAIMVPGALSRAKRLAARWAPWIADRLALPVASVAPIDRLSSNPAIAELALHDPLIGRLRVRGSFWRSVTSFSPAVEPEDFDACPVVVAHPGDDRWTPPELSRRVFDRLGGEKRWVLLPGGGHYPLEPDAFRALEAELLAALG